LDLDFKDEKISSLNKELEDLHTGGASEEEIATLKRQKHELEMRLKEEASYMITILNSLIFINLIIHTLTTVKIGYDVLRFRSQIIT
jgi:hypothetical protein